MAEYEDEEGEYTAPPHQLATWLVLGIAVVLVLALASFRTKHDPDSSRAYESRVLPPEPEVAFLKHEMDDEYFPCGDCHDDEITNFTERKLEEEHELIEFAHGNIWCLHCHVVDDRNWLRLADLKKIEFEESSRLCTQCHPKKLDDWNAGVHGKQTGYWHGAKERWTCVECHNPHTPLFKQLEPLPPPMRPALIGTDGSVAMEEVSHE